MAKPLDIAIIGGGIGGLTAARALLRRGFEVVVYESAPELKEVGAGVALRPNVMKAMRALGLEDQVRVIGYEARFVNLRSWKGRLISRVDHADIVERYGAPICYIHRADLLDILAESIPPGVVHLSARCDSVSSSPSGAVARFTDGSEIRADAIVGADGIHSAVRTSMFGENAPKFTGQICYRSVISVKDLPQHSFEPYEGFWIGPHGSVVVYGMRRGELINVVAHYDDATYKHESWITECDRAEVIERYRSWHPSIRGLITAGERWYKWALYDRDPIPRWTHERVTLLGDAAHPMLPNLGQGAGQAIEDGCVLATAVTAMADDPSAALALYERSRRPRATQIVLASRDRGADNHLVSPVAAFRRNIVIAARKRFAKDMNGRRESWMDAYDPSSESALVR